MKYQKLAHSKLHHIEVHTHDDGTHRVEAHVMHRPPHPEGKKMEHMPVAEHDYPNRHITMTAEDHEEAAEHVSDILMAHKHDPGRRRPKRDAEEPPAELHGDHDVTAAEEYEEAD